MVSVQPDLIFISKLFKNSITASDNVSNILCVCVCGRRWNLMEIHILCPLTSEVKTRKQRPIVTISYAPTPKKKILIYIYWDLIGTWRNQQKTLLGKLHSNSQLISFQGTVPRASNAICTHTHRTPSLILKSNTRKIVLKIKHHLIMWRLCLYCKCCCLE